MRIIAGKYRGLKLCQFQTDGIRPTADRTKESLFNILSSSIIGARVLDLFAGSGSVGIEALSRGAGSVHFNDCSQSSLAVLNKNLVKLKGENNFTVTQSDFAACLSSARCVYDFIYIDPPYVSDFGERALKIISERRLLSADGVAVMESDAPFTGEICGLRAYDERKYGKAHLTFFKLENSD